MEINVKSSSIYYSVKVQKQALKLNKYKPYTEYNEMRHQYGHGGVVCIGYMIIHLLKAIKHLKLF